MEKKIIYIILFIILLIIILSNFFDKDLDGKKIVFVGDSIMAGYGNDQKSFEYYFKQELPNATLLNVAKDSATISTNSPFELVIKNQIDEITGSPDIIVFEGGANDIIDYAIGFLDKSLEKDIGTVDVRKYSSFNRKHSFSRF